MKMLNPVIGAWYKDLETHQLFEIVAWDTRTLTIETQFLDGELSEYDLDNWRQLKLVEVETPEDWRTPFELDGDDAINPDEALHPQDWNNPLSMIEPDTMYGVEDY